MKRFGILCLTLLVVLSLGAQPPDISRQTQEPGAGLEESLTTSPDQERGD